MESYVTCELEDFQELDLKVMSLAKLEDYKELTLKVMSLAKLKCFLKLECLQSEEEIHSKTCFSNSFR